MTAEQLALISGAALSLLFSYIPGLRQRYDALTPQQKALTMAGMLALVALAIYGLNCTGQPVPGLPMVTCDNIGAWKVVSIFIGALAANQGTYLITRNVAG